MRQDRQPNEAVEAIDALAQAVREQTEAVDAVGEDINAGFEKVLAALQRILEQMR